VTDSGISGTYVVRANDGENGNPSFSKIGHTFSCWNDGTNDVNVGVSINVSANVALTAQWTANVHNVTMPDADQYGSYSASETLNVAYGTTVTLTYTPATGYDGYVATWSVNGETLEGNTFTMPDENVTVTVSLAIEVTLNNTFFGCDAFTSWNSSLATTYSGTQSNVTVTLAKGTSQYMYINDNGIRMYNGNTLTFVAPEGYYITEIDLFGANGFATNLSSAGLSNGTWTGTATQVVITGNTNSKNMTGANITLAEIDDAVATTTTIDASGITNTDCYISTIAGSLSATVSANNHIIEGATITWSGNKDNVATIDPNTGAVTLVGTGSVTFTASYVGETGVYQPSNNTYGMTVTNSAPVVDYAVLPFVWQGGSKSTFLALNGVTAKGLGSDYAVSNAPYLIKLDDTGDYIQVKTDSQPNVVTIGVKMLGGDNTSTITIQGSADGETFTDVEELTISGAQNDELTLETTSAFTDNVRYVRMLFTKGSNVGVGLIAICKSSLDINGHSGNAGNWYLIASPLTQDIAPTAINGLVAANDLYDLYRFNQNPTVTNENYLEWENYKIHSNDFVLENGKGYLYASQASTTLYFNGECNTGDTKTVDLDYSGTNPDENMRGWNLVGNPFTTVAYADHSYFVMDGNGTSIVAEPVSSSTAINPFTGVFVQATETGQSVTFSKTAPRTTNNKGVINLALSQQVNRGSAMVDKAVVSFNEGDQLGKFVFMESNAKLYIPKNGKDYAIAVAEGKGEMPVNFKAQENGTYTLNIDTENVEMNYLHLIDNMTGMDVDLLQTPSYTFDATTNDYASRFRLVFSAKDGPSTGSETFAFYSNGNWVVNNEGEATLQVIDVNGRIVSNETINGTVATSIVATPGVYMLRLVNGNEVKTQKIVVR
jgi:hypothetical protein